MTQHPTTPLNTSADQLSWLAGSWRGVFGEDVVEEHWSTPAANTMMAMFRWQHEGQVRFYELMAIEQEPAQVVLRIKHFDPGLVGWEARDEAVTFILVSLAAGRAVFWRQSGDPLWLVYEQPDRDSLIAYFERPEETAGPKEKFHYYRAAA